MPFLKASVRFWAFVSTAYFLLAVWLIERGDWGNWVHAAWMTPGVSFVSWQFACFTIVSAVFTFAGVVLGWNAAVGLRACGVGFLLAMLGFAWFAQEPITTDDVVPLLIFFVGPGLTYLLAGQRCQRAASEFGARVA